MAVRRMGHVPPQRPLAPASSTRPFVAGARPANAGAAKASGEILLFLHADTSLPPGFGAYVRHSLSKPNVALAAFTLSLSPHLPGISLVEWGRKSARAAARLALRRPGALLEYVGLLRRARQIPAQPLLEDVDLVCKARELGEVVILEAVGRLVEPPMAKVRRAWEHAPQSACPIGEGGWSAGRIDGEVVLWRFGREGVLVRLGCRGRATRYRSARDASTTTPSVKCTALAAHPTRCTLTAHEALRPIATRSTKWPHTGPRDNSHPVRPLLRTPRPTPLFISRRTRPSISSARGTLLRDLLVAVRVVILEIALYLLGVQARVCKGLLELLEREAAALVFVVPVRQKIILGVARCEHAVPCEE